MLFWRARQVLLVPHIQEGATALFLVFEIGNLLEEQGDSSYSRFVAIRTTSMFAAKVCSSNFKALSRGAPGCLVTIGDNESKRIPQT